MQNIQKNLIAYISDILLFCITKNARGGGKGREGGRDREILKGREREREMVRGRDRERGWESRERQRDIRTTLIMLTDMPVMWKLFIHELKIGWNEMNEWMKWMNGWNKWMDEMNGWNEWMNEMNEWNKWMKMNKWLNCYQIHDPCKLQSLFVVPNGLFISPQQETVSNSMEKCTKNRDHCDSSQSTFDAT